MPQAPQEGRVIRPALPILLAPLAGIWAGLFLAEGQAWKGTEFSQGAFIALLVLSALTLLAVVLGRGHSWVRVLVALVVALVMGFTVGVLFWSGVSNSAQHLSQNATSAAQKNATIRIIDDASPGAISQSSLAVIKVSGFPRAKVRIFWDSQQEPLPMGTVFTAEYDFKPLKQQQGFLFQKGVCGSVSLKEIRDIGFPRSLLGKIHQFRQDNRIMLQAKEGEGAMLLRGVLLGDTTELHDSEAGKAYKTTGLAHLLAISGSHMAVITALLSWLISKLKISRRAEMILITTLLISFVLLTGLQPSAIRACIMTSISRLGPLMGRRGHVPSALAAAGVSMMLVSPAAAFSAGFWLSMFAVFGITVFCPLISRHIACLIPQTDNKGKPARILSRMRWAVVEPLSLTVTAQLATVAISAPLFSMISIVSPLANLLVTPFLTLLVGGGIATLCLMPLLGPVGSLIIDALCRIADLTIVIAKFCATLPNACLPVSFDLTVSVVVFVVAAALIYLFWPQPSKKRSIGMLSAVVLISVLLFFSSALPVKPQVVMLDVGQGDSLLIRDGTSNVLIDTGNNNSLLLKALARQRVSHLDAVIITHLDDDHYGALSALNGTVSVDHVFFAEGLAANQEDHRAFSLAASLLRTKEPEALGMDDMLCLSKHITLQVVWPDHLAIKGDNPDSICLNLSYDANADGQPESRALFTGDAEKAELGQILQEPACDHFDIYKVGHHGSKKSCTSQQVQQMGCTIALIGVGAGNHYGHPAADIIGYLEDAGVAVYRTDLNGDTVVLFDGQKLKVRCDTMNSGYNNL